VAALASKHHHEPLNDIAPQEEVDQTDWCVMTLLALLTPTSAFPSSQRAWAVCPGQPFWAMNEKQYQN